MTAMSPGRSRWPAPGPAVDPARPRADRAERRFFGSAERGEAHGGMLPCDGCDSQGPRPACHIRPLSRPVADLVRRGPRRAAPGRGPGPPRTPRARPASGTAPAAGPPRRGPATPLRVTAPSLALRTTRCWSANAATCGRWVTTSTWAVRASAASRRPDLDGGPAAHPGVDLVEHQGRHRVGAGEHDLDGEHHARQLASRGTALQRRGPGAPACGQSSISTSSTPWRAERDAGGHRPQALSGDVVGARAG